MCGIAKHNKKSCPERTRLFLLINHLYLKRADTPLSLTQTYVKAYNDNVIGSALPLVSEFRKIHNMKRFQPMTFAL